MTAAQYIRQHPATMLAQELKRKFGATSRKEVHIDHGTISTSSRSLMGQMMARHKCTRYSQGGMFGPRKSQGYWFAIYK